MSEFEKQRVAFFKSLEPFNQYFPTLNDTLNRVFYGKLPLREEQGLTMSALGHECAASFDEIRFVCTNGYGLAGTKLLRSLYERVVTAAYFAKSTEAATAFLHGFDLDFGRLLHANQDFFKAQGADPNTILPPEYLSKVEEDFRKAKAEEKKTKCPTCGKRAGRMDVVSMATNAIPALVPYQGMGYIEPTFHVHCTWYSVLATMEAIHTSENHTELRPYLEGQRALRTLQLAHLIVLHAAETQNTYFQLGVETELAVRREEHELVWQEVSKIHHQSAAT